jgi:PRC-barrel domain
MRFKLIAATVGMSLFAVTAFAQPNAFPSARLGTSVPQDALTVTDWYKQNVYDPNENKIGEVMDVLVDKSGRVTTLIIGVGGFLGAGEKDVAVPDLPPLKWSSLKYDFRTEDKIDGKEEAYGRRDRREASTSRCADGTGPAGGGRGPRDRRDGSNVLSMAKRVWRSEGRPG